MHGLLGFIFWFSRQTTKFNELKYDPSRGAVSKRFGVKSILFITIGFIVSAAIALGGVWMVQTGNIVFVILGVALIAGGALSTLNFFVRSIFCAILQLRLNSKAIGFIALVLCLLVTIAAIIGISLIANSVLS